MRGSSGKLLVEIVDGKVEGKGTEVDNEGNGWTTDILGRNKKNSKR